MKNLYQIVGMSVIMFLLVSCTGDGELENVFIKSELYTEYFNLTEISVEDWEYLDVSVKEKISKSDVEKHVVGSGWKSVAVYELDKDKNVVGTKELKDNLPLGYNQSEIDCFEIKGFGENQLIQYGLIEGRYEYLDFTYNESNNSISIDACWFVAHKGKLVFLSDDVMVCVDGKDWPSEGRSPFVYMVVFKKVNNSTLKNWRKQCPDDGLWI
ncbi:MAG: hypothetical protein IKU29_10945 [Parabacteroides sp.]|nr:hypothetical protein [Parabacteroides sp.]